MSKTPDPPKSKAFDELSDEELRDLIMRVGQRAMEEVAARFKAKQARPRRSAKKPKKPPKE